MADQSAESSGHHILVVMPSWVGDVVMATPTLRALREVYPEARISTLIRRPLRPLLAGCPWVDRIVTIRTQDARRVHLSLHPSRRQSHRTQHESKRDKLSKTAVSPRQAKAHPSALKTSSCVRISGTSVVNLARRLRSARFDMAVLLTNSFRSALLVRMAQIRRRIGYDRDGRGFLLTDRLLPRREPGRFVPVSSRDYYLAITRYLGAVDPDPRMALFSSDHDDDRVSERLAASGIRSDHRLVIFTPGASFGNAKMWDPNCFAMVADRCVRELGAAVAVAGAPKERSIIDAVIHSCHEPIVDLSRLGVDLALLKSVIRRSSVVVTNDTGPRHMAIAFGTPVVTVFGPTDPAWTEVRFEHERQVMVKVFCGPCQKKQCPLDHRCMTQINPEMVFSKVVELLEHSQALEVIA